MIRFIIAAMLVFFAVAFMAGGGHPAIGWGAMAVAFILFAWKLANMEESNILL